MEINREEIAVLYKAIEQADVVKDLAELQLVLIGGGIGDTII